MEGVTVNDKIYISIKNGEVLKNKLLCKMTK